MHKKVFTFVGDERFDVVSLFFEKCLYDSFYENEGDAEHDGVEPPFGKYRVILEREE